MLVEKLAKKKKKSKTMKISLKQNDNEISERKKEQTKLQEEINKYNVIFRKIYLVLSRKSQKN